MVYFAGIACTYPPKSLQARSEVGSQNKVLVHFMLNRTCHPIKICMQVITRKVRCESISILIDE